MSDDKKSSNGKKTTLVILVILAIVVIAGAGGGTYYVGTDSFCAYTCHQMKTRAALWQKSSHSDIKCISCHSKPGFVGEFEAHIDGLNYLKSFLKKKTTHITIFATRRNPARLEACINCHPADTLLEETESIRINHVSHILRDGSKGFLCTDCHKDMIHGTHSFEIDKVRPDEERCIACHIKEGARLNCQSCHIKKVPAGTGKNQVFVLDALEDTGTSRLADER